MNPSIDAFESDDRAISDNRDAEAVEQPGVLRTLNLLSQELDRLDSAVAHTAARLDPVLRSSEGADEALRATVQSTHDCDVAKAVGEATDRVIGMQERLDELADRIDV